MLPRKIVMREIHQVILEVFSSASWDEGEFQFRQLLRPQGSVNLISRALLFRLRLSRNHHPK